MARYDRHFFTFRDVPCFERGISLLSAPKITVGAERGSALHRAALAGDVWVDGGAREGYDLRLKIACRLSRAFEAAAFLSGSGLITFSWRPNRALEARIAGEISFSAIHPGLDPMMQAEVELHCQPLWRMHPEPKSIWIAVSGAQIFNPGTAPAVPKITIYGEGDFSLTIGEETLYFTGVPEGGIAVDSESMRAYSPTDQSALDACVTGTPFRILPGAQTVSWSPEEQVSSLEIEPGWRFLA